MTPVAFALSICPVHDWKYLRRILQGANRALSRVVVIVESVTKDFPHRLIRFSLRGLFHCGIVALDNFFSASVQVG